MKHNQCMGVVRRPWWSEANCRIWPGCRGHTSLFERHSGILMTTESRDLGIILLMPDSLSWKRPIIQNINNILGYINKYTEIINVRKHKTGEELIYPLSDKSIYIYTVQTYYNISTTVVSEHT